MGNSLELKNVSKYYITEDVKTVALKPVSLSFQNKEFASIVGSSGSGKSTLLNILGTLDKPTSGQVLLDGIDITTYSPNQLADVRFENIGFIFQQFHLLPAFTVIENILLPLFNRKVDFDKINKAKEILKLVGLKDKANSLPSQLSGGQQQRVAIARALITEPHWILADEPTGNLDTENSLIIINLLKQLYIEKRCGIIYVTHDIELADMAHRKIVMRDGNLQTDKGVINK